MATLQRRVFHSKGALGVKTAEAMALKDATAIHALRIPLTSIRLASFRFRAAR